MSWTAPELEALKHAVLHDRGSWSVAVAHWALTSLREKLVKIGAKIGA